MGFFPSCSVILAALLLIFSSSFFSEAFADIYRWIDDEGNTHISDSKPTQKIDDKKISTIKNSELQVNIMVDEPGRKQRRDDFLKQIDKESAEADKLAAKRAKDEHKSKRACRSYRASLKPLEDGWQVVVPDANGGNEYLSDRRRKRAIAGIKKLLKKCK